MNYKKLKLVCNDGIGRLVKLIDTETGEELLLPITEIVWKAEAGKLSKLTMNMEELVPAELTTEQVEILCKNCPCFKESLIKEK